VSSGPVYVLDSDVFMTAARSYYAFDLVPAFWVALVREASQGRLRSIDRVKAEIDRGKDTLKQWANGYFHQWFASTNQNSVLGHYCSIIQWAKKHPHFTNAAKHEFADQQNADPWLVAYAKATNSTVVTNEKYDNNIRRRIKIPNVCVEFYVTYVDLFQMLRELGLQFN
jgi:hypothetical protein